MQVGKPLHEQLVASTSKSPAIATSKATPLATKAHLQRPAQTWLKLNVMGKLDQLYGKTKDTKAAEMRAVKTMEQEKEEEVSRLRGGKKSMKEKPRDEDKVDLCPFTLAYLFTSTTLLHSLAQTKYN
jgi:hypothetical protein